MTVALLGVSVAYKDQEKIIDSISLVGWHGFLFLCLFSSLNYGLRFFRWKLLLRELGDRFDNFDGLACYLSGFAMTTTPAKVGEVLRSMYFSQRHKIDYAHSIAGLLAERVMDALAALFLGSLALYVFEDVRWIGGMFTICILAVVVLLVQKRLLLMIVNWARFIEVSFIQKSLDLVPRLLDRTVSLLNARPFSIGVLIGLIAWAAEGFAYAWLIRYLGGEGPMILYLSIFCIAVVAGALTFVPGGLGGTEIVMYVLTVSSGVDEVDALAATILIRLATLWYAVLLGLISVLYLERSTSREVG